MLSNDFKIVPLGDNALKLILGETISLSIHRKINQLVQIIRNEIKNKSITDILPTYKSIVIYFDPEKLTFNQLENVISKINLSSTDYSKKRT